MMVLLTEAILTKLDAVLVWFLTVGICCCVVGLGIIF